MSELSTMDMPFSPDMGGKEALSALGYSRVKAGEQETERWEQSSTTKWPIENVYIVFSESYGACRLAIDTDDNTESPCYMSMQEMQACIKRINELVGGRQ